MLIRHNSARNTLGDADNSGSFWDQISKNVSNVVTGVTQYQLNKQSIQAGNASAANYAAPGTAPVMAGPSAGLPMPLILGGIGILAAVMLLRKKGR